MECRKYEWVSVEGIIGNICVHYTKKEVFISENLIFICVAMWTLKLDGQRDEDNWNNTEMNYQKCLGN